MEEQNISELGNCVDRSSGTSYEVLFMEDGSINVCDYDGSAIASFASMDEAEKRYMFF